jgi:two-component system, NtrC family, response regulator AtoC
MAFSASRSRLAAATSGASPVPAGSRRGDRVEPLRLLIVEDDPLHARLLRANLDRPGSIRSEIAPSAEAALDELARSRFDAVLTDLALPGVDGIELVQRVRATDASLPLVIMTAYASVERAVEGMRQGATDFIAKPVNVGVILAIVERALAATAAGATDSRDRPASEASGAAFIRGDAAALDEVRRFAARIAAAPGARVLLTGESGTGKSLLARAIHGLSGAKGRFVEVNCAALPPHLLESELFGHEKGAFTDARERKRGLIEEADGGTLLLDEIGAMPLELQAKLLLVLESRAIRRVGGVSSIPVRVRVIAATNEDLRRLARERAFRQDLLYRLDVASIEMPPLRSMPSAIPDLARHFVTEICVEHERPAPAISERSLGRLVEHPWPGNVRELRNAIERALIFHAHGALEIVPPLAAPASATAAAEGALSLEPGLTLDEVERRYLAAALASGNGGLVGIASRLGISRKTLWDKRRRFGL